MPYIVKIIDNNAGSLYVKRTSHFGDHYGNMVFTKDRDDALRFTKCSDAEYKGRGVLYRIRAYDYECKKHPLLIGITGANIIIEEYKKEALCAL